ncbi:endonuclease/exonuclease/phosphatase family protein [Haladaptatus halobius]|uniref:endonuclease/exonuclease/phosphatase family protein n=1 Tax=Haladaptatus halobius TaxID=2884875 RepID=UPI001D0A8A91|nr:endonuclease/exonuclease/phosphatase family protein [Haladaptatus halobius]
MNKTELTQHSGCNEVRVATLNVFGALDDWPARREVMVPGFEALRPDLVALQEVVATPDYNQAYDLLGDDYHIVHHSERESDGRGISIASRWPITDVHELALKDVASRPAGFACSSMIVEVQTPAPIGRLLFANHLPDWQLTHEYEREQQTITAARFIENLVGDERVHVAVAGDLNATPDAATIRFWTGKQSLGDLSVCYRDAWASTYPDEPGHTFTPDNYLTTTGDGGDWALELGRRIDYILVRCTDHGPTLDITDCQRLFDQTVDGVWASDHFGVTADLSATTPSGRSVP